MLSRSRVSGWCIWLYAQCVRLTARWQYEGVDYRTEARAHGRVIYALWHQDGGCFGAALAREEPRRLSLLVFGGQKLGLFQGFADLDGFRVHPTGGRAETAAAMDALVREIRAGGWSAITPDGPYGPPRVCKPGIVELVRAVDGVVLPVSLACSRFVETGGWDGGRVPLPFARFTVRFGAPVRGAAHRDDERLRSAIEQAIDACSQWRPDALEGSA